MSAGKFRRCFTTFIDYVEECDLFAPNILLRYKNDTQFKTLTSAIMSISLVVFFVVVFSSRFLECVHRQNVSIQTAFIEDMDPTLYTVNTSNFMFVVGVEGMSLSGGKRFFDINITQWIYDNGVKRIHNVATHPCSKNEWEIYGDEFYQRYQSLNLSHWLCPTANQSIELQGKFSSNTFKLLKVGVSKCTGTDCFTDAELQAHLATYKAFKVIFYYTKSVLNPEYLNPVSVTLDDSVYLQFSLTLGSTGNLFFEGYTLDTDYSLTPKQQVEIKSGITTSANPQIRSYSIIDAPNVEYASLFIRKSPRSRTITRSYEKYDEFLSYIGGLFGLITFALGVPLYYYNLCCYELSLATNMFTYKKDTADDNDAASNDEPPRLQRKSTIKKREQKQQSLKHSVDRFNFIVFLGYLPYQALRIMGAIKTRCGVFRPYYDAIREIRKQIDIGKILQKFTYYDRIAKSLLDEHQRNLLHIYTRENICQLAKERGKYKYQIATNVALKGPHPPNYPNTHDILKTILQQHLTALDVNQERVQRDLQQLAKSYKQLTERQDPVSQRILKNLDPQVTAMLNNEVKEHQQVINPLYVQDVNDAHLEIKSEINDNELPRRGQSYSDHGPYQISNEHIDGVEIQLPPPPQIPIRKIKSMSRG